MIRGLAGIPKILRPLSVPEEREGRVRCSWMGRDSAVGIATRYGLDGPGRDFPHPSRPALGPTQVKRPGPGLDHPPPSNAEVKERVELYLYSTSGTYLDLDSVLGKEECCVVN